MPDVHHLVLDTMISIYNSQLSAIGRVVASDNLCRAAYPAKEWIADEEDDDFEFSMIGSASGLPISMDWNSAETFSSTTALLESLFMPSFPAEHSISLKRPTSRTRDTFGRIQEMYGDYIHNTEGGSISQIPHATLTGLQNVGKCVFDLLSSWGEYENDPQSQPESQRGPPMNRFPWEAILLQLFKIPIEAVDIELNNVPSQHFPYLTQDLELEYRDWTTRANCMVAQLESRLAGSSAYNSPPAKKTKKRELSAETISRESATSVAANAVSSGSTASSRLAKKSRSNKELVRSLSEVIEEARQISASAKRVFSSLG